MSCSHWVVTPPLVRCGARAASAYHRSSELMATALKAAGRLVNGLWSLYQELRTRQGRTDVHEKPGINLCVLAAC